MDSRNLLQGAADTPPPILENPSVGHPTDGNGSSILATAIGARAWYELTEEMRNVILDAGLTPDSSNLNQFSEAIQKFVAYPIVSMVLGQNGYIEFDGGENPNPIIQWGYLLSVPGGQFSTWTYLLPFPNAPLFINGVWATGTYSSDVKAGFVSGTMTQNSAEVGMSDSSGIFSLRLFSIGF